MLNMFTFLTRRVSRELMGKDPWAKAPHAKTLEAVLGGKCPKCDFFVCEWLLAMCSDSSGAWKLSFLEQLNEVEFLNSGRVGEGCGNLH